MADVVIVDTTVFLNLLNVPDWNDDREDVYRTFQRFFDAGATLLLPLATVFETGGHIADVKNGGNRRRFAKVFCEEVNKALRRESPWVLVPPPDDVLLEKWLHHFPDFAMQGISLSDLSQIELWKSLCKKLFGDAGAHLGPRQAPWELRPQTVASKASCGFGRDVHRTAH